MMSIFSGCGNIYVLLAGAFAVITILKIFNSTVPQLYFRAVFPESIATLPP
jgi:hypothetical protein